MTDERGPLHRARRSSTVRAGAARSSRRRARIATTGPLLLRARDPHRALRRRACPSARQQPDPPRPRLDLPRWRGQPDRARLLRRPLQAQARPRSLPARSRHAPATYHGTYFPAPALRPTVGKALRGGRRRGQCLPLTAEGIRPALYFGSGCGRIVQRIFDGGLSLGRARHYRATRRSLPARLPDPRCGAVARRARADAAGSLPLRSSRRTIRSCRTGGRATAGSVGFDPGLGADRAVTGPALADWRALSDDAMGGLISRYRWRSWRASPRSCAGVLRLAGRHRCARRTASCAASTWTSTI